jgi:DNA polymerase I-like protein with 3'-5' exonuclease and polymerase domains
VNICCDTEGSVEIPWSAQISLRPGHGYVILAGDSLGLSHFRDFLLKNRPTIIFHYAQHDIAVLRAMGIDIIEMGIPFGDTMIEAYLLGENQGLKSLAFRLAGAEQPDFMDLLAEPAEEVARGWLADIAWGRFPRHYGAKPDDREKALRLVERMWAKEDAKTGLRERWASGRAREILQDELLLVGDMPEPTLDMIPLDVAVRYAGRDTDLTARIAPVLDAQIDALGLRPVLELDLSIVPIVEQMQRIGIGIDVPYLQDLGRMLDHEYAATCKMIEDRAGRAVNPASGDQVADWLFNDMGLPWKKKTKGGRPETGKRTLEALSKDYSLSAEHRQCVALVVEARGIQKDKSFCDSAQEYTRADGRLHPRLLLTRTGTGRTAAKNPNVLAFPKHSVRGKLVRGGPRGSPSASARRRSISPFRWELPSTG